MSVLILLGLGQTAPAQQILSDDDLRRIRDHLPTLSAGDSDEILHDPKVIWYDDSVGVVHQEVGGFANSLYVTSDINDEFPWKQLKPGGYHLSTNVTSIKGFLLPRDEDGNVLPIVWYRAQMEGLNSPRPTIRGWDISSPVGTVWIEVIFVDFGRQHHACEVRFRIREYAEYGVEVHRPFVTPDSLAAAIVRYRPGWESDPTLSTLVTHLLDDTTPAEQQLKHRAQGNRAFRTAAAQAFNVIALVDEIPPVDDGDLVSQLLDSTPFGDALGSSWGPTTNSDVHVWPNNGEVAFLGSDRQSCARCHVDALASARRWGTRFDLEDGRVGTRAFTGWVRGWSEGILSFQPTMAHLNQDRIIRRPTFRQEWLDTGILAHWDPQAHSGTEYSRIAGPQNNGRNP